MDLTSSQGGADPRSRARVRLRALADRLPSFVPLGALVATVTGLNLWWLALESRPPRRDMGHHLLNSLIYLHGFDFSDPMPFLTGYLYNPPLVFWVTDVFYGLFGSEATSLAIASNIVWLAVLVFATYGIGKRLWNVRVGWLSVVFVVTAPMVVSSSKEYLLDLPVTAVAALTLYPLIRSDGFSSRRYSLLVGLACGCGLLVRSAFPIVVALPMVYVAAIALADGRQRRSFGRLLNLAGASTLTLAIAGAWYVRNGVDVLASAITYGGGEGVTQWSPPVGSVASATWYLWNLLDVQLYLLPFLFVLAGVAFCFRKRELAARNVFPLLLIVGTYVGFTLVQHKDPRYTLPMLPALAVLATSWLEYVSARVRAWAATLLVAYGALAFLVMSFGTSVLPKEIALDLPGSGGAGPSRAVAFAQHGYIIGAPSDEEWHQAEAVRSLTAAPAGERVFTYEGADTTWFNRFGLRYYALRYDAELATTGPARFLVYRGPLPSTPPGYAVLGRWRLPDGSTLVTYERRHA